MLSSLLLVQGPKMDWIGAEYMIQSLKNGFVDLFFQNYFHMLRVGGSFHIVALVHSSE